MDRPTGGRLAGRRERLLRLGFTVFAVVLAACSGTTEIVADAPSDTGDGFMQASETERPVEEVEEEVSDVPEAIPNVEVDTTTTTTAPPTTTIETTSTETTTTLEEDSPETTVAANNPLDVPGAIAAVTEGLGVITEPGDPLNVRTGPGVDNPVVRELVHQTTGITSTHIVEVNGSEWCSIELDGEGVGWVAGRFLQRVGSISFCSAPANMPTGLSGNSVQVDIDDDPGLDTVTTFTEELSTGRDRVWVRADLTGGGEVAGFVDQITNAPESPDIRVMRLSADDALNFNSQFVVEILERPDRSGWRVLDLDDCDIEVTTLNGQPFSFNTGSLTSTSFEIGCIYGGAGNRFVTVADADNRTTNEYELRDGEWTFKTSTISNVSENELPTGFTTCIES